MKVLSYFKHILSKWKNRHNVDDDLYKLYLSLKETPLTLNGDRVISYTKDISELNQGLYELATHIISGAPIAVDIYHTPKELSTYIFLTHNGNILEQSSVDRILTELTDNYIVIYEHLLEVNKDDLYKIKHKVKNRYGGLISTLINIKES